MIFGHAQWVSYVQFAWKNIWTDGAEVTPMKMFKHLHEKFNEDVKRLSLPRLNVLFSRVV